MSRSETGTRSNSLKTRVMSKQFPLLMDSFQVRKVSQSLEWRYLVLNGHSISSKTRGLLRDCIVNRTSELLANCRNTRLSPLIEMCTEYGNCCVSVLDACLFCLLLYKLRRWKPREPNADLVHSVQLNSDERNVHCA